MNQARLGVDADMSLHAEMPVVAFLRRMHLGVAGLGLVLGRRRRSDKGRIDDGALAQDQPAFGQVSVDRLEDLAGEFISRHYLRSISIQRPFLAN